MAEHYLDDSIIHQVWDNSLEPRIAINPGDTVVFECREASNKAVTRDMTQEGFRNRKRGGGHPLTGPVYINGATPSDTLVVDILNFEHKGWGWNGHVPNFGLLADDFDSHFLQLWRLEGDNVFSRMALRSPYRSSHFAA